MAEQSSLDQALARIMQPLGAAGAPAPATTPAATPASVRPAATDVTLGGTPPAAPVFTPDPAIAAAQKQIDDNNKAIVSLMSQTATPAATAPAASTAPAPSKLLNPTAIQSASSTLGAMQPGSTYSYDPTTGRLGVVPWDNSSGMQLVTSKNINNPAIRQTLQWGVDTRSGAGFGENDPATAYGMGLLSGSIAPPAALTPRAWIAERGITPQAYRTMAQPERQALRQEFRAAR